MNYNDFQNQANSGKLTLAILDASRRLMGWTLHSGSIYSLEVTSFVSSIEDSSVAYSSVASLDAITAGTYYYDKNTNTLYLQASDSSNPNGRYIVLTEKLFFSSEPISLPHDLSEGFEVYFEPMIRTTSKFGVEIDTVNQMSEAIDGSGSLTLFNDNDFWPKNFDKLHFEDKPVSIYSYSRDLLPSEAKKIYQGFLQRKSYLSTGIQFTLKDQLSELSVPIPLVNIEDLGERTSEDVAKAKQRMILGRVFGHVPINIDQVLDGYPLGGTVSVNNGSVSVTGSSTSFLLSISPDDKIILGGVSYTVATVTSNTALEITETYTAVENLAASTYSIIPANPKRFINRKWIVAGHPCRQPLMTIGVGSTITRLVVDTTEDVYAGDTIYVGILGSGEVAKVANVQSDKVLILEASLGTIPAEGSTAFKPSVQNVRIGDTLLEYDRDYSFDPETAIIDLTDSAEENATSPRQIPTDLVFTNASRTVTGTGLDNLFEPGYMVGVKGNSSFFEVLAVDETTLTLRTASTFTDTEKGQYKSLVLDPNEHNLTCDVLGRTDDGTPTGNLIKTAPEMVKLLLTDAGLASSINEASFLAAESIAYQELGVVVPQSANDNSSETYREVINKINRSVFGSLVQSSAFELMYLVLRPNKATTALRLSESDVLSFSAVHNSDKVVKTAIVTYAPKEVDYATGEALVRSVSKTSDVSTHVIKTNKERTFETYLSNEADARIAANRWAFLLENSTCTVTIYTKLQAVNLEIGSIIDLTHRKLFERFGSASKRKLLLVQSVKKSGTDVEVEAVDLSNAFNRVACIMDSAISWEDANEDDKIFGGYITDEYGLIDNDPETFGQNLIW